MEILSKTTEQTQKLAERISADLKPNDVVLLYGELGSGKTTFSSFLVKALGFTSRVQSPTFVIARKYTKTNPAETSNKNITTINHLDLYRLTSVYEIMDLGLKEMIEEPHSITLIEWPELIESHLVSGGKWRVIKITFEHVSGSTNEHERKIHVQNLY